MGQDGGRQDEGWRERTRVERLEREGTEPERGMEWTEKRRDEKDKSSWGNQWPLQSRQTIQTAFSFFFSRARC